jgi:anti-sigma B factor antagonist
MEYKLEKDVLTISLEGELNSVNSESVGEEIDKIIEDKAFKSLVLDFDNVSYISSAGLRIFLAARKHLSTDNEMTIINASPSVMEVLELTGFTKILNIEKK